MDTHPSHTAGIGDAPARVGFCAIVGLPNVGKSTLLNRVLGLRLAAVSPRPQTTRNRIVGVHNGTNQAGEPVQIVFVDTPGAQRGTGPLRRYMREQALSAAGECDVALLMIDVADARQRDPQGLDESRRAALEEVLDHTRVPVLVALNKIDRIRDKQQLLPIIDKYAAPERYAEIIPVSARTGDGIDRLLESIGERLPRGPKLFPDDMVTDRAEHFLAAELIREQLFRQLGKEVPYSTAVEVEQLTDRPDRDDVVMGAVIHVERESQKPIVIGKGGQRIKQLGQKARESLAQLFGCAVHLKLFVRVTPSWSRSERSLRELGYE